MGFSRVVLLAFTLCFSFVLQAKIYIPVGDPNYKKISIALAMKKSGNQKLEQDFFKLIEHNLDYTDYFKVSAKNFVSYPSLSMLSSKQKTLYKSLGVDFVAFVSFKNNLTKESYLELWDVNKDSMKYKAVYPLKASIKNEARELANSTANGIVKSLSGKEGIFRTRILMSCGKRTKEIYIMDFDGRNIRRLTRDRNFSLSPSWSPSGDRIVFTSYKPARKGGFVNPNLYLVNLKKNKREVISAAPGLNLGGSFHPTEKSKLIYTFSKNGRAEIYSLDLDKKIRKRLTNTLFFSIEPHFAPSGKRIVFSSSKTGRPHIWVANTNGSNLKRLTFAGHYNSSPNWSPVGDKIVFVGQENKKNNFNIFSINPDGNNLKRLTGDQNFSNERPYFSPDGRFIAFSSNRDGQYRVYVMDERGENVRVLSPKKLGHCKQPAWSPYL